jgi:hypothetical protein
MNVFDAFKTNLPLTMKLLFVWKSLTVWPYYRFKVRYYRFKVRYFDIAIAYVVFAWSESCRFASRIFGLNRHNMTAKEMTADDKVWADWFQQHSWNSMFCKPEEKPAMEREIKFMAKQRMIGLHFNVARKAFAKAKGV